MTSIPRTSRSNSSRSWSRPFVLNSSHGESDPGLLAALPPELAAYGRTGRGSVRGCVTDTRSGRNKRSSSEPNCGAKLCAISPFKPNLSPALSVSTNPRTRLTMTDMCTGGGALKPLERYMTIGFSRISSVHKHKTTCTNVGVNPDLWYSIKCPRNSQEKTRHQTLCTALYSHNVVTHVRQRKTFVFRSSRSAPAGLSQSVCVEWTGPPGASAQKTRENHKKMKTKYTAALCVCENTCDEKSGAPSYSRNCCRIDHDYLRILADMLTVLYCPEFGRNNKQYI